MKNLKNKFTLKNIADSFINSKMSTKMLIVALLFVLISFLVTLYTVFEYEERFNKIDYDIETGVLPEDVSLIDTELLSDYGISSSVIYISFVLFLSILLFSGVFIYIFIFKPLRGNVFKNLFGGFVDSYKSLGDLPSSAAGNYSKGNSSNKDDK